MSWFKTTRYHHYFTQYAQEINGSFTDDPIATYAAGIIANGGDIGSGIVSSLQNGKGVHLKRYYQYAKARFGNRFWNWNLSTKTGNTTKRINGKLLAAAIGIRRPHLYVASSTLEEFHPLGPYLNHLIKEKFGIDEFNTKYNGKEFVPCPIKQTPNGYAVLKNITDADPEYLYLDELPEPSKGVIYWEYSEPVRKQTKPKKKRPHLGSHNDDSTPDYKQYKNIPPKYPTKEEETALVKEWAASYNPFGSGLNEGTNLDEKSEEELNKEQGKNDELNISYTRTIYRRYATYKGIIDISNSDRRTKLVHQFDEEDTEWEITYVREHILYLTESGKTNSDALKYIINNPRENTPTISGELSSANEDDKHAFKLYPYLPLQDFGADAWEQVWLVPKLSKDSEIVKLQHIIDEANKDEANSEYNAETNEPNQINPKLKGKNKKKQRKNSSKLYTYNGQQYTLRALQRRLARYLSQKRKIKFNRLYNEAKPLTESATKRHIDNLAQMLGVDYEGMASSMIADADYSNGSTSIKGRNIMPAVNFSSPIAEVQAYWFYFFKRLYKMYGEERDYLEWLTAVQNANSFNDLPMKHFSWKNQSGLDYGNMAWMFIKKTTIKGKVRKIKRTKSVKEIKRGKPISIFTIDDLKDNSEPLLELADDKYHTSKNKTEHCIGGQEYVGKAVTDGLDITNVMKDFNYTFFCRQISEDEMEVYAVAGLCFSTKMISTGAWANAWYDLGLQYSRNHNRYVGKRDSKFSATYDKEVRISKRHYYVTKITHFGVMPIDYNIIRRIGGTELERMSIRIPLLYGFTHTEQKGKSKGFKRFTKIAPILASIGFFAFAVISAGLAAAAGQAVQAMVAESIKQLILVAVTTLAMKFIIMPLLKAIGLKGIVAAIVATIIMVVAMVVGGMAMDGKSILPYGSEVGKDTAVQATKEVGKNAAKEASKSISESISQAFNNFSKGLTHLSEGLKQATVESLKVGVKEGLKQGLSEVTKVTAFKALTMLGENTFKAMTVTQQEQMANIQSQMKEEQERFDKATSELEELQEAFDKIPYDVKAVLEQQRLRFRMYDVDSFLTSNTQPDTYSATFDYLSNFINMKLNVDPATVDVAMTPDFSFVNQTT